jgi:protein associated with RNAse G/E
MMPTVGSTVWIERRKWKDDPHYGAEGILLGEDEHGHWVGARPGSRVYKGTGPHRVGSHRIVWCVPRDGWFLSHHLVGHPELDIYIDIAAPAAWSLRGAKLVDLDLDVLVWNDGRAVELVDEDEFELHRRELAYPDDLVRAARAAASHILEQATAGAPPFDGATAARWIEANDAIELAPASNP